MLLCATVFCASARAEDAEPPKGAAPPGTEAAAAAPVPGEIVVFGDLEVARKRQAVINDLRQLGYRDGKRKDGYTLFRPESPWKPSVRVYDDGFVVLRRSPPRFMHPGDPNKPLNYLWCLPPFTPMCLRIGGVVVSKRKLTPQKERVASALEPGLRGWRDAISARAMSERVGQELPDQLDALWLEGVHFDPRLPKVADPAERRRLILELWSNRTCTPEGQQVRDLIAAFILLEVQQSPFPAAEAELVAAEAKGSCGARIVLPRLPGADGDPP